MNEALEKSEELLFNKYAIGMNEDIPIVFIIASPRTGSTLLYQLMINFFELYYFTNFINDYFAQTPLVGAAIETKLNTKQLVEYKSSYGKTEGIFGPSEGSNILKNWFGGEHPSQIKSSEVVSGKKQHMLLSLSGLNRITGMPIIIKNAWNCFRIKELAALYKKSCFIWLRRDIGKSALSDLESRYRRGGALVWNSATTANYLEIQQLPYWEQVVEQQFAYNKSIEKDINKYASGSYIELWYEDVCDNFNYELNQIKNFFVSKAIPIKDKKTPYPRLSRSQNKDTHSEDSIKIIEYIKSDRVRFDGYQR